MKSTDKLSKKQVLAIPTLLNHGYRGKIQTMAQIARRYKVSEQAVYYWVKRLRADGFEIKTRVRGQTKMSLK